MSVVINNDHGYEVLKKVADEVTPGDNREYKFKVHDAELLAFLQAGGLAWQRFTVNIPANSTTVIDNNLLNDFSRINYIINFKGMTSNSTKGFELAVQNNNGSLSDTLSVRLGGPLQVFANVTDDSVDMFLEIQNDESEVVTVSFIRNIL